MHTSFFSELPRHKLSVLTAPPGGSKTAAASRAACEAYLRGERVMIVTLSNTQSFDLARRIASESTQARVILYHRSGLQVPKLLKEDRQLFSVTGTSPFIAGPCIVISNASKWAWIKAPTPHFDLMIIDDANGISESKFMQISGLADRYVLIGEPKQSPPIIKSNIQRWASEPLGPHQSCITTSLQRYPNAYQVHWRKSQRIPVDTLPFIQRSLFPQNPISVSEDSRRLQMAKEMRDPIWRAIDRGTSLVMASLPEAYPGTDDVELSVWISQAIRRILHHPCNVIDRRMGGSLNPAKIGVICTDHAQVHSMERQLGDLSKHIHIDVPFHFRSQERALIFAFHPLTGQQSPSPYHWDPALLAQILTRHRVTCILVSRSLHFSKPESRRSAGEKEDRTLDGFYAHKALLRELSAANRVFQQSTPIISKTA